MTASEIRSQLPGDRPGCLQDVPLRVLLIGGFLVLGSDPADDPFTGKLPGGA